MRSRLLVVALIAVAALHAGCGIEDPYQPGATATTATMGNAPASRDADEVDPDLSAAQRDAQLGAERAASVFLQGYLPSSYGQGTAQTMRAATPELSRELAANPPRVRNAVMRSARPRVRQLRVSGLNSQRAYVLAQIDDGSQTYATSLTIQRRGPRWLVAAVR
jgi:hypothetical protein